MREQREFSFNVEPYEIRAGDEVWWHWQHGTGSAISSPLQMFIAKGSPSDGEIHIPPTHRGGGYQAIPLSRIVSVKRYYHPGDWKAEESIR